MTRALSHAIESLRQGAIIACPTESVYGLSCDPFNELAVTRLLALKKRSVDEGLIVVAAHWAHVKILTAPIPDDRLDAVCATWPGPVTWIFPKSDAVPAWISGQHDSIAIRISNHPTLSALCAAWGGALVSTSANTTGHPPARTPDDVRAYFGDNVEILPEGRLGALPQPTKIFDALTGQQRR